MCVSLLVSRYCHLSFCFFKQKTAYEMRISDWSSDVCSSDLHHDAPGDIAGGFQIVDQAAIVGAIEARLHDSEMFEFQHPHHIFELLQRGVGHGVEGLFDRWINVQRAKNVNMCVDRTGRHFDRGTFPRRSEEHTYELQ